MKRLNIILLSNICLLLLSGYLTKNYIITEKLISNFFANELDANQISNLIDSQKKWDWLGYLSIPILYFLKNIFVTLILIGLIFISKNYKSKFSILFYKVVLADMIFLIPITLRIIWFSFQSNYSLEDIQYFFPGSALSIFDPSLVQKWLLYPLQALNIFELGFWLLLAYQLKEYFEGDFTASFKNVAISYGSSYVVWVLFVMFLTLNYT